MRTVGRVVLGVTAVAVVGVAGLGAYNLYTGLTGGDRGPGHDGPVSVTEVRETARDFLAAWADKNDVRASQLTNDAASAAAALSGYRHDGHVARLTLKAGRARGTRVPFDVTADISYEGTRARWSYASQLSVVRGRTTGRPLVDWTPSVLHPELTADRPTLRTGLAAPPSVRVVDRDGKELTKDRYPSLGPVLAELRKRYAAASGTGGRIEVWAAGANDTPAKTLHVVAKGRPGTVHTTLDARAQSRAEEAVARRSGASVVALKPSTGEVLAVANSDRTEFNPAFQGATAPGSTFKIITSAALLESGKVTPGRPVPCPRTISYQQGMTFHNVEDSENPTATFAQDFAASCNTAFVSLAGDLSDSAVADEAREVFGIGLTWHVGVETFDGSVPTGGGDDKAAALIGQGRVQLNPLTVASVAATAQTGTFRQPVIVPRSLIREEQAKTERGLSPAAVRQLRSMMRLTATNGTAARAMSGLSGDIGAKTGSAEIDGQQTTNAWFTAYRNDMAAAAVVVGGGHGGDAAGPVVRDVLTAHG
ncbi:penicillin-binding transpeptidase domain-containing protein [Streptomyces sparsogenes]|uniref:penicillin-binding transpeptidase domain-containing protein n=1 Tax=Streptomyces sparsogenes TaxID=67365 RepID=UPI00384B8499